MKKYLSWDNRNAMIHHNTDPLRDSRLRLDDFSVVLYRPIPFGTLIGTSDKVPAARRVARCFRARAHTAHKGVRALAIAFPLNFCIAEER